jgi:hypothetical protein
MPTYSIQAPNGRTYSIDGPAGATQDDVIAEILRRDPSAGQTPAVAKPAGFSLKDIGVAFGQGAVGSTEAIANVAGAGNVASQYLGEVSEGLGQQYSPARQAEMQRQKERMKKAEESGSTFEEVKAGLQNIYEAPLQSVAQGLGSFVPYLPAMFAGPIAGALGLSARGVAAANAVVGTAQGAGSVKGAIYDAVYKAEKESGFSEEEAKQKADAAQSYASKNLDQIALGAGLGYVASKGGVEKFLTKEGREKASQKLLPRVGTAMAEESLTEGAQGGQERLAENIALQRTGRDVPTFKGVAGQAAQDAIIGGLTAGPIAAVGGKSAAEIKAEEDQKKQDAFEQKRQEFLEQQKKTEEQLQVPKTLALPPPSKKVEPVREDEALINPVGNITKDELGQEVADFVDQYRKSKNLPPLKSYTIEDIKDAMPQENPVGDQAALDSILTAKTGFTGEQKYSPQDVINAAVEKNIAHETKGFQDFLQRTAGERDLNKMSEPQLYAAFKSLADMKRENTDEQLVLPEGSNASRFTKDQYEKSRSFLNQQFESGTPVTASSAREGIKGVTGLQTDRDVGTLFDTLVKNEDLNVAQVGDEEQITPATPKKDVRAPLPEGYSIEEGLYEEGEQPAGFEITPEGRNKPITTVDLEAEVAPKIERLAGLRKEEAAKMLADVNRYSGVVKAGQTSLDSMEARGLDSTEAFKKEKAKQARRQDVLSRRIQSLMDRIEEMSAPLKSKPVGTKKVTTKKHTLYKDGKALGTFPSRIDAEASMLSQVSDAELDKLVSDTRFGGITDRAAKEKERRKAPEGMRVRATEEGLAQAGVYTKQSPAMAELEKNLVAAMSKFGLKDVALKVVRAIENNAEGSYEAKLIKIAFDAANPVRTMRHEAIHALKELGFFTRDQWRVLESKAKNEWVDTYLGKKRAVYKDKEMSRLDAYRQMGLSESEILEEAIADAFGDFDVNKAPPGMIMALLNKLRNFFKALRQALTGAGFESAEDIFGKIEEGKLGSQMDKADKAGKKPEKLSLPETLKEKTIDPNDVSRLISDGPYDDAALRILGSQITKTSKPLEVDEVGVLFDQAYLDKFGQQGDWKNQTDFQSAVAQAVKELTFQMKQSKSGLDWYDQDIADAFKLTQRYIPSLKKPEKRALFSVIAGIMSPSTNARDNWVIAAQAYQHYEKTGILPGVNPASGVLWMGGLESANKKKQLDMLNAMLQPKSKGGLGEKGAVEWLQGDHSVAEITKFREKYGGMGKSSAGGKATDIVPGYTTFGPKVGPFVMNINGLHEVTVDVWMTRTFNRYFGQMMGSDGKMVRAPTEPQRVAVKQLATEAAKELGIKPYQVQSVLWFFEQQMFNKLGTGAKSYGFSDGAIKFIETQGGVGVSSAPSANVGSDATANQPTGKQNVGVGPKADKPRARADQQTTQPRQIDEDVPSGESTVRSSDRGRGRRSAANGEKLSLREDIRSYRGSNEASPETHTRKSIGDGGSVRVLGAKPIAQYIPTESFKGIVNGYGHQSPVFYEISGKNADVYEQAIQESKDASPYGASVYVYPVEDYAKMRLFMTEDGKSGVALKDDDIVSVFSGPPHKGSVNSSIQLAVQEGGRRLDAFDTVLPELYQANGFQVVGRMKWNEDYKPDNWDKQTFSQFNNGEPDVVYMSYNPDDNRTVSENPGEYFDDPDELGQAQKDAVNTYFNEGTGYGTARQAKNARGLQAEGEGLPQQRGVRRSLRILDDETRAKYPNLEKPVKGLPAVAKVDGVDVTFGPYMAAREAAVLHAEKSGIPYRQQASYHKLDPEFSKMLANAYARMLDEPNAPQVKAAYKAWADETIAQYEAMLKTGITVEFFPDSIDTYGNPRNSILDVLNNNHLYVFPADGGFGKGGITDEQIKNNPALALTDITISGRKARVVEVFRATHDFFGHIKEGFGFRAEGEENAFQSHVRMYSPLAARAMTAGTRGQNSEVNFGPNAAFNKTASGKDTKYADQKIGLLPEWASTMSIEPDVKSESLPQEKTKGIVLGTKQPQAQSFSGTHYGKIKTDNLDASKYGTGLQGSEARRLSGYKDNRIKKRVYFYVPKYNGQMPLPESGVGNYVYTQTFDNIASPEVLSKLYAEARGDANTMESLVVDAGYDGYAAPSMGMMVILNHDVPVNYEGTKAEFDAKKPKYSLRNVREEIEALPNGQNLFSAINRTTTAREEKGFIERITSIVSPESRSTFRAAYLNRYNQLGVRERDYAKMKGGIERLADENAESAALMSDLHAGVTAQVLGVDDGVGGIPVFRKGYTTVSNENNTVAGPIHIFKPLAALGDPTIYQAYQFWAGAKRAERLLAAGKEANFTPQDVAFAKELQRKYPEFVSIQKEWIKFNNGLVDYMVQTGVVSEQNRDAWIEHSDYVPFYRQLEGEKTIGPNIFQSISGVKAPKKLQGSDAPIADFLETIVRNTHSAVQAGMKNVAAQRAADLAVKLQIGERLANDESGPDIVHVLEKGKRVSYRVGDQAFVNAVKSLNIPDIPFLQFISAPADLLRNLVTKDPGFMLANLMRDSMSAYVTSGANIKPVISTIDNFSKALFNKSSEFEMLKKAGVVGGYDYSRGVEASTKSFAKQLRKRAGQETTSEKRLKPITSLWDYLEKGTEASDAATRIAVFKETLKETGNEAEAMLRSLEVMNFNRKGSSALVRIVTAGIPFLNARIQGLDLFFRAGIRPSLKGADATEREKAVQRAFFARGAMLMAISLMYAMAVKDDPDYEKQEEETRDNNWLIPKLGVRIPTPFEVGFLFKTMPERIYRLATGSDTGTETSEALKRGLISTFAFNPVPQTFLPVAETLVNFSVFTWRPIIGQAMEGIEPKYQIGPGTSVLAEKIGDYTGLSPMKVDHIIKGYTGTMGMYFVDIMDTVMDLYSDNPRPAKRFEQMPVLKRFLVDPDARGNVTAYYAFKHSVDQAVRTVNFLEKRLDEDSETYQDQKLGLLTYKKYISNIDKQMKSLQDEATMIRSSGMSATEKRDALLEITRLQNEIVEDIKTIRAEAKED